MKLLYTIKNKKSIAFQYFFIIYSFFMANILNKYSLFDEIHEYYCMS